MLRDADVVLVTFQVGGLEAYRHDVEIPRRYGSTRPSATRSVPAACSAGCASIGLEAIAADMHELCPDALLLNTPTRWRSTAG